MKHGFVKVAAATPDIRVADVAFNMERIMDDISEACRNGAKILAFPELCLTGYTCSDLFTHDVSFWTRRRTLSLRQRALRRTRTSWSLWACRLRSKGSSTMWPRR